MRTATALKLTALLAGATVFTGCDDFLDRQPLDTIVAENFYRTADDMERAAFAAYTPLQDLQWTGQAWRITEIPSDNTIPGGTDPDFTPIDDFTVTAENVSVDGFWRIRFRLVALANILIAEAPDAEIDVADREGYIAEGRFLRALAYLDLVRIFGDVPLILRPPSFGQDLDVARTPADTVMAQIVSDLEAAAEDLPVQREGSSLGRATRGAALALLAKAQLTAGDYRAAQQASLAVMDLGVYSLMPDFADNWRLGVSDNNAESVFQAQHTGCGPFGTGNAHQAFFAPWGEGITKDRDGWGSQIPSSPAVNNGGTTIVEAFEEGDLRADETIMSSGNYYPSINPGDGGYTYPARGASRSLYNIKKYVVGSANDVCFMSTPQNAHIIRYADVLLSLAEASVELDGGVSTNPRAVAAFNAVRERAGLEPVTSLDREGVFAERRVEFAFEQQRWYDLLRMGEERTLEIMRLHGKSLTAEKLLFPIPSSELKINTSLTQNPGY